MNIFAAFPIALAPVADTDKAPRFFTLVAVQTLVGSVVPPRYLTPVVL